jgi:rRNA-processing protein FCF1
MFHRMIVDTNAIIYLVKKKRVDSLKNIGNQMNEIIIPTSVVDELRVLSERSPTSEVFRTALGLTATMKQYSTGYKGDDAIIQVAKELGSFVLTNDKDLKNRLKKLGIGVYSVRTNGNIVPS